MIFASLLDVTEWGDVIKSIKDKRWSSLLYYISLVFLKIWEIADNLICMKIEEHACHIVREIKR